MFAVPDAMKWILYVAILAFLAYALSGFAQFLFTQRFSHLGELKCSPAPSFFFGHLQNLHDAENTNLFINWLEQLGTIFTYRGFIGGYRLVPMDTRAIIHILSRSSDYIKPGFVRDTLASMTGQHGLLVAEGESHKRQRKILNPSFTTSQVQELMPIFYEKAMKLRDIWFNIIDTEPSISSSSLPTTQTTLYAGKLSRLRLLSPATPTLPLTSPIQVPRTSLRLRIGESGSPHRKPITECIDEASTSGIPVRVDVLHWLGRATLDVIGLAGFGYAFDALVDEQNVLAAAFAEVFSAARNLRLITVLQAWFPILHYVRTTRRSTDQALKTMHQIGIDLIRDAQQRLAASGEAVTNFDFRGQGKQSRCNDDNRNSPTLGQPDLVSGSSKGLDALKGRDLFSLLIKSNLATSDKERMSQEEILSQISTFMAAGHETTSSALAWTLYELSRNLACQARLREEISEIPTATLSAETLSALPYLDMVVRESLRLNSPVSQTMRMAIKDDIVPVAVPYRDAKGRIKENVIIKKGDIINIPIQAMNKSKSIFGEDAEKFIPERWEHMSNNAMPTLYSSILTFLHGSRACIGYRFAILEMKVFLFVLLRSLHFEMCPHIVIEKRVNVVTRPLVKSEPEHGNQMPLLLSRAPS
ncbi:cytochrome P450 [Ramaria rubella]|nr:cytochrome P450 [Ramaria rubella]